MTEEPWNKHTPGDPMPCKCRGSVVEVKFYNGTVDAGYAGFWDWGKFKDDPDYEIADWRFVERAGDDVVQQAEVKQ